jgi:hypothetical protein
MLPSKQASTFCFIWATERNEERNLNRKSESERLKKESIQGIYKFGGSATCLVGQ